MHAVHYAELKAIWPANPRIPSTVSRRAWAVARNLDPQRVNSWWSRAKLSAKLRGVCIPDESYELDVGVPPEIPPPVQEDVEATSMASLTRPSSPLRSSLPPSSPPPESCRLSPPIGTSDTLWDLKLNYDDVATSDNLELMLGQSRPVTPIPSLTAELDLCMLMGTQPMTRSDLQVLYPYFGSYSSLDPSCYAFSSPDSGANYCGSTAWACYNRGYTFFGITMIIGALSPWCVSISPPMARITEVVLVDQVAVLVVSETLQTVFFFVATYDYLITRFGDYEHLLVIGWTDTLQLVPAFLSAFVVQVYFAYCIYILNRKAWYQAAIIVTLSIVQLTAGIIQDVLSTRLGSLEKLEETKPSTVVQGVATLACDIIITACLLKEFGGSKTNHKTTNSILHQLIVNAINRGALTALTATLNLVLFLALPGTFYFFFGLFLSSKLYMNSALATLNSREHIRSKAGSVEEWPLGTTNTGRMSFRNATSVPHRAVEVVIQSEFHIDGSDQKAEYIPSSRDSTI
ncbi:hypothetical protein CVT24_010122 [Panaeolus cyanescens]|uniref:DUF6534 domain-containing protein n=1 Tax=Panaeolus cyanescens TaxID=181874 RepID=A0A409WMK2_9AGAR|nr:hypothetical protein CVT24_010122 [Panaeolus cyanescens]